MKEVIETCRRLGITIGPIANMKDIAEDPHYQKRGSIIEIEDPATGVMLTMPNIAFRMLATPGKIRFAGLPLGSANEVIYTDLLGYSDEEIANFKDTGVI
jgi:crotonobetainyl-CoA:carnitine CoA-transferase CaiB-like acyl-CoA transferase